MTDDTVQPIKPKVAKVEAPAAPAWHPYPPSAGVYIRLHEGELKLVMVSAGDVASKFFSRCGLWHRLEIKLP